MKTGRGELKTPDEIREKHSRLAEEEIRNNRLLQSTLKKQRERNDYDDLDFERRRKETAALENESERYDLLTQFYEPKMNSLAIMEQPVIAGLSDFLRPATATEIQKAVGIKRCPYSELKRLSRKRILKKIDGCYFFADKELFYWLVYRLNHRFNNWFEENKGNVQREKLVSEFLDHVHNTEGIYFEKIFGQYCERDYTYKSMLWGRTRRYRDCSLPWYLRGDRFF